MVRVRVFSVSGLLTLLLLIVDAACRQMCLSCQYVDNPKKEGIECSTAPLNWTFGDTRMRCNYRCTIDAHFDKKTGDSTFFYRGCSPSDETPADGCHEDHVKEYCSYSCVGTDYCNDRAFLKAPSIDKGGQATVGPSPGCWFGAMLLAYLVVK